MSKTTKIKTTPEPKILEHLKDSKQLSMINTMLKKIKKGTKR